MKKTLTTLIVMLFAFLSLQAQKFSQSINSKVFRDLKYVDPADSNNTLNNQSLSNDYIIEMSKSQYDYYKIDLISSNDKTKSFTLYPLSLDLFTSKFKNHLSKLVTDAEGKTVSDKTNYNQLQISTLFAKLVSSERTEENKPVVAKMKLKDNIPVKFYRQNDTTEGFKFLSNKKESEEKNPLPDTAVVKNCQLEMTFFNGFIEKVELEGTVYGKRIRFSNTYSIGISSSSGIKKFVHHNIFSFHRYNFNGTTLVRDYRGRSIVVNFADLIDYNREIDINANDISPKPTVVRLNHKQDSTTLYKEESTRLFEAVVYSDFLGVFNEENPNGIIQTEVSKKFFINTNRFYVSPRGKWLGLIFPPIAYSEGYGFVEYLDLNVQLSKIEENNKFLRPDTLGTTTYFKPLKILQHQSFSFGADLNIFYLENQNYKINTNLDLGFRFGRSGLQIDENTEQFFNTISTSALINFQFLPEKRYGFNASNRIIYFEIYDDDGLRVNSLRDGELKKMSHWYNAMQLEFHVNTSNTGKLFLRYNLTTELDDWDNNFSQVQFGYSFFILRQNGKLK